MGCHNKEDCKKTDHCHCDKCKKSNHCGCDKCKWNICHDNWNKLVFCHTKWENHCRCCDKKEKCDCRCNKCHDKCRDHEYEGCTFWDYLMWNCKKRICG